VVSLNGLTYSSKLYVVFGNPNRNYNANIDMSTLDGTNGFTITGEIYTTYQYGHNLVTCLGDINNDGAEDISIIASADRSFILWGDATSPYPRPNINLASYQ
jgi:hypothetical protein